MRLRVFDNEDKLPWYLLIVEGWGNFFGVRLKAKSLSLIFLRGCCGYNGGLGFWKSPIFYDLGGNF